MASSINGQPSLEGGETASLYSRSEQYEHLDKQKSNFIRELIVRYEYVSQQNEALISERNRERDWVIGWQFEKQKYEKVFKKQQRTMNSNPYVMVLIDGDGMIFLDDFLRDGEKGGRRAAKKLQAALEDYIEHEVTGIPHDSRIVCRIYANVRGLGDVLARTGAIEETGQFGDFVRGFTQQQALFDFIDVGPGKDRADEKLVESFKFYSDDYRCRRLLFGCSHDNGYARTLEKCSDNTELLDKVVLLEGVPFEKELVPLPYTTRKFPGLFRETKLVTWSSIAPFIPATPGQEAKDIPKTYNIFSGLPTRFPPPNSNGNSNAIKNGYSNDNSANIEELVLDSPLPSKSLTMGMPRTPSSSTIASDTPFPALKPTKVATWASKAALPPPPSTQSAMYKAANRDEVIARNRAGQRVDPPCRDYDRAEVDRIKKVKMCNVHFLRGECPFQSGCTHSHAYNPTGDEITTLRLVARMAPCLNGSGCQDIKCIYGHRCPAPPHKTNHVKGTKSCIFGEGCKFPPELHDLDTNVVKTLVIR